MITRPLLAVKRYAVWLRKHWGWALILVALWAVLGWDRALNVVGALILFVFGLDLYERFRDVEREVSERRKKVTNNDDNLQ